MCITADSGFELGSRCLKACVSLLLSDIVLSVQECHIKCCLLIFQTLGRHLVVFNCSEQLTSAMLVQYLFGMIRSGSWSCFENVDCVEPGILSSFGEHLSNIRISLKCLEKFVVSPHTVRRCARADDQKVCFVYPGFFVQRSN